MAYLPSRAGLRAGRRRASISGTEAPADRATLGSRGVYRSLSAVQGGNLAITDGEFAGALSSTSRMSLPAVLEQLVPALSTALPAD